MRKEKFMAQINYSHSQGGLTPSMTTSWPSTFKTVGDLLGIFLLSMQWNVLAHKVMGAGFLGHHYSSIGKVSCWSRKSPHMYG